MYISVIIHMLMISLAVIILNSFIECIAPLTEVEYYSNYIY